MNDLTNTAVTHVKNHLHATEFGRFKLKPEITTAQALAAYQHMVEQFLSQQPDWQGQQLIQLEDGSFIDLAFARDLNGAKEICNAWMQQPVCLAFLQLIEPIIIEFGTVIYCKPAI